MAYTLGNKCAKNLCKPIVLLQLIIENVETQCSDVISVKWQTIKTNNSKISHKKNKHLSILTGTSNDAGTYTIGICGSRPKHKSRPSLIFMNFRLCLLPSTLATLSPVSLT